jgi:hypothetical protein
VEHLDVPKARLGKNAIIFQMAQELGMAGILRVTALYAKKKGITMITIPITMTKTMNMRAENPGKCPIQNSLLQTPPKSAQTRPLKSPQKQLDHFKDSYSTNATRPLGE